MSCVETQRQGVLPSVHYTVECRVCGRWMAVARAEGAIRGHYIRPSRPGERPQLCNGSGQPGILLFPEMSPVRMRSASRRFAEHLLGMQP